MDLWYLVCYKSHYLCPNKLRGTIFFITIDVFCNYLIIKVMSVIVSVKEKLLLLYQAMSIIVKKNCINVLSLACCFLSTTLAKTYFSLNMIHKKHRS